MASIALLGCVCSGSIAAPACAVTPGAPKKRVKSSSRLDSARFYGVRKKLEGLFNAPPDRPEKPIKSLSRPDLARFYDVRKNLFPGQNGTPTNRPEKSVKSSSRLTKLEIILCVLSRNADPSTPLGAKRPISFESLEYIRKELFPGGLPQPDPEVLADIEYWFQLHPERSHYSRYVNSPKRLGRVCLESTAMPAYVAPPSASLREEKPIPIRLPDFIIANNDDDDDEERPSVFCKKSNQPSCAGSLSPEMEEEFSIEQLTILLSKLKLD